MGDSREADKNVIYRKCYQSTGEVLCREATWPEKQSIMGGAVLDRVVRGGDSPCSHLCGDPSEEREGAMLPSGLGGCRQISCSHGTSVLGRRVRYDTCAYKQGC